MLIFFSISIGVNESLREEQKWQGDRIRRHAAHLWVGSGRRAIASVMSAQATGQFSGPEPL